MKTLFKYIVYVLETFEYNMFFRRFYKSDISPFANLDIESFKGHLERNDEREC